MRSIIFHLSARGKILLRYVDVADSRCMHCQFRRSDCCNSPTVNCMCCGFRSCAQASADAESVCGIVRSGSLRGVRTAAAFSQGQCTCALRCLLQTPLVQTVAKARKEATCDQSYSYFGADGCGSSSFPWVCPRPCCAVGWDSKVSSRKRTHHPRCRHERVIDATAFGFIQHN